ncbi:MAG: hypothetical protein KGM42_09995 [Hyphomicrobiales bacterium]|nr:hypothetical protein [Hyphomicrobiales bacterium]
MRFVQSSALLRNVLIVDAAFSGASGVTLVGAAAPLAAIFGLPHALVLGAGVFLLPYALFVGTLGLSAQLPRGLVWFVVAGNAVWAIESVLTLAQTSPTQAGIAAVIGQAAIVAAIGGAQAIGLKRSGLRPA